jgi:hypothetical protein
MLTSGNSFCCADAGITIPTLTTIIAVAASLDSILLSLFISKSPFG